MFNDRILMRIRTLKKPSQSWFNFRNVLVLLVLAVVIYFAPFIFQRGHSIVLAKTIRSHGGKVYFTKGLCFNGYCLSLPSKLSAVVGVINEISLLNSEEYPINDEFIDSLGKQPHLSHLYLQTEKLPSHITDNGLAKITNYPLQSLSIPGGSITDSGFNVLEKIPTLEWLVLHDVDFTGEQFHCAPKLKNLNSLYISSSKVTDAGLKNLASLPNLHRLGLNENCINGSGLYHLSKSKKLSSLDLGNSKIKADSLYNLTEVKPLRYLSLKGKSFGDSHVLQVANLSQLTILILDKTQVTDQGLIALVSMEKLQELYLADTQITDKGIKNLTHSPSLIELDLSNTLITDQVKDSLLQIPKLNKVNVSGTKLSATIQALRDSDIEVMTTKPGLR